MSASVEHCRKAVQRLQSIPLAFGVDRAVLSEELTRVLLRYAISDAHVTSVLANVEVTANICPTPAGLKTALAEVADSFRSYSGDSQRPCGVCAANGGNWVSHREIRDGAEYWYAGRCNCARGRYLSALDKEHPHSKTLDTRGRRC